MVEALAAILIESVSPASQAGLPEGVLRIEYRSRADERRDWALCLPPATGATWLVMVHGHGSHGDQIYTRPDLRDNWLPRVHQLGLGLLSPNLRDNAWMSPAAARDLRGLLAYVRQTYKAERFILASGSMGGTSNLIYAVLYPEDVAGVVALCPATDLRTYYAWCRRSGLGVAKQIADAIEQAYGGSPEQQPEVYARHSVRDNAARLTMPTFIVHGTADALIPVSETRRLAAALAEARNLVYVEIPDGHHDSPLTSMTEALDWVLARATAR